MWRSAGSASAISGGSELEKETRIGKKVLSSLEFEDSTSLRPHAAAKSPQRCTKVFDATVQRTGNLSTV